jgi:starch-binding outer membrane protein, SusD/RagB family
MRFSKYMAVAALVASLAGCDLEVTNPNEPDRQRILASPAEVEALASSQMQQLLSARGLNFNNVESMMKTASFENTSALANSGFGPRSAIPRGPIDNAVGNAYSTENFRDYRILSAVARNAADILIAMNAEGFTVGSAAADRRLRAWTHFISGLSYGYVSLIYDATGIARPEDEAGFQPELSDYPEVNAYAIEQLDEALRIVGEGISDIPGSWLTGPGSATVTAAQFARVIRSYRALIRSDVARTPEDRAAVNWAAVVADAENGIQSDLMVEMNPSAGWDYDWLRPVYHFRDGNWHQMGYYMLGMADVSGAYADWLATDRDAREYFTIVTPDRRFPQGATRADQLRAAANDDDPLPAGQYFRNRNPDKDEGSTGWRASQYDHYRFRAFADAERIASFPLFTQAQNDMMRAEGLIRTGNPAGAVPLINRTREMAGLPPVTVTGTSGADCVPQVPAGPAPNAGTRCGNLMEAMMWEKLIETAYTNYGGWFFDMRGWGILPVNTAIHWPVPHQELDARQLPIYNTGGGNPGSAGPSIYGFGTGPK